MSLPTAVFIDTSILAGQRYNFESTRIKAFVEVAKARSLRMLLPHPTEQEIERQLKDQAQAALQSLQEFRRKSPFLAKWKHFPQEDLDKREAERIAVQEFHQFLGHFNLQKLGYEGIDLKHIMWMYDIGMAPFGKGQKRKEFPDAFAIASVTKYAHKHSCIVAVVSDDGDLKAACESHSSLLYFKTLPSLTELLLADQSQIDQVRAAIQSDLRLLAEHLVNEVDAWVSFGHRDRDYKVSESKVQRAEITDIHILGLGAGECTLTFDADVEAEHLLQWTEVDDLTEDEVQEEQRVLETSPVSGTAKVTLDPASFKVTGVPSIQTDTWDIKVTENPRKRW